ncbi:MAG: hydrogen peroxide-inducible genes activator [Magnetospirillum sp.]|nr:hydrogen peroxide-inducible genes activator [Magnetospirillum sp.]
MITPPTLRQLRYLVALADERHFGRAAEACLVTQSTLSSGLKELEQLLGVALFERTKRRVAPTAAGLDIAERARRLLRDAEELTEAARAAGEPLTGPLRIGVIPTVAPFLVPRILPTLYRRHPALKPYLREEQTGRLIAGLEDGRLDVLLLAFPIDAPDLTSATILDDRFWIACPHNHPLAACAQVSPDQVPRDELLLLEDGHCLRDHALSACHLEGGAWHEGFRGTSLHTLVHMVAVGLGVTLLPEMAIRAGLADLPGLAVRPLSNEAPPRRIGLAWRRSSARSTEFRLLAGLIGEACAET